MPAATTRIARKTTRKTTARKTPKAKAVERPRKPAKKKANLAGPQGGAPTYLTPQTQGAIVQTISSGNYFETAVRYVGLAPSTAYGWMARGRKELERRAAIESEGIEPTKVRAVDPEAWESERRFAEFVEAVQKAEAEAETYAVVTLRSLMGPKNDGQVRARAALGYLERKHPRRWSRAERSEISVDSTSRVEVILPTEEEQKARTAETFAVLEDIGARELLGAVLEGRVEDEDVDD